MQMEVPGLAFFNMRGGRERESGAHGCGKWPFALKNTPSPVVKAKMPEWEDRVYC